MKNSGIFKVGLVVLVIVAVVAVANINFDSQIEKAREYISNSEYSKAVEILEYQLKNNGSQEDVYLLFADYYIALEKYQDALNILNEGTNKAQSTDKINAKINEINTTYENELNTQIEQLPIESVNDDSLIIDEIPRTYEFDTLQNIFININENTTASDLETFIEQYSLAYTVEDYNGSNIVRKITTYEIAYTEGAARQRYADSGDYIKVSFNKSDGSILHAVYSDVKSWKSALFYNYGIWFSFQLDSPSEYTGYYVVAPFEKEDGIVIKYDNGHETTTNYFKCDSAEDSIKAVIDDEREG